MTQQPLTNPAHGSGEIRTHGTLSRTHTFQTRARKGSRSPRRARKAEHADAVGDQASESDGETDPDVPLTYHRRSVSRVTWALRSLTLGGVARPPRTIRICVTRAHRFARLTTHRVIVRGAEAFKPIIYGLVDPLEPGRVRYVGQTRTSPLSRYLGHLAPHSSLTPRAKWVARLLEAGRPPDMVLLETVAVSADPSTRERWWILALEERGGADLNSCLPRART
jgi:hypothetical protein